jgi:hypothetical protein
MDDFLIGQWVGFESSEGASGYGFVGGIRIKRLPSLRINHPENFVDVVSHLPKSLFTRQQGSFLGIESMSCLALLVS